MGFFDWFRNSQSQEASTSRTGKRVDLIPALHREVDQFIDMCVNTLSQDFSVVADLTKARRIAGAFQAVQVVSFVTARKYLSSENLALLSSEILASWQEHDAERFRATLTKFEGLDRTGEAEQFLAFAQSLGREISGGSELGAMAGSCLAFPARELQYRSWALAARSFGDLRTVEKVNAAILALRTR